MLSALACYMGLPMLWVSQSAPLPRLFVARFARAITPREKHWPPGLRAENEGRGRCSEIRSGGRAKPENGGARVPYEGVSQTPQTRLSRQDETARDQHSRAHRNLS